MEKRRSPLVSIPPFGRGLFKAQESFDPMDVGRRQERVLTPPFIVSMSPPGYPSAWLHPCSARLRFARQDHCSSATTCPFLSIRLARDSAKTQTGPDPNRACNRLFSTTGRIP